MNISGMKNVFLATTKKYGPEILTAIGISGMFAAGFMAVRATPKAMNLIEKRKQEIDEDSLSATETVKTVWKCYLPAAITSVTSTACIVGASSVRTRRNAALATACTISETALREYREKVVETIGDKKEEIIRDAISKDKVEANPVSKNEVVITGKGETLCYETFSGRYFKSDIETIKRVENELNRQMLSDGCISLNELYIELGLGYVKMGDVLGWNTERGLIDIRFSSQISDDGKPCLVIDYLNPPQYDF